MATFTEASKLPIGDGSSPDRRASTSERVWHILALTMPGSEEPTGGMRSTSSIPCSRAVHALP